MDASDLLEPHRVVPVVVIDNADDAVALAEALVQAGMAVIEITLRTAAGLDAIAKVADAVPAMLVGAGSVRRAEQFAEVRDAGADFVVSPGHTDALVNAAHDAGLPFVPGASTPSEMISLLEKGYRLQKFFPAEVAGGIGMLKSVASPIPEARFMPTGGITPDTAPQFLALPNVAAIGGSWIAPAKLVAARDFETIGRLAADAMSLGV